MNRDRPLESDLIEFIRSLPQELPTSIERGIGDDGAVFEVSEGARWVVSTDLLIEEVHFRLEWTSPRFLGQKSCRVNVSDLAAMGARPHACLLSLGIPPDLTGRFFEEFVQGFVRECQRFGMPLVGGDLSQSQKVVISVTAWGSVKESPIYRSAAQAGDYLLLIGDVGLARLGLEWLGEQGDPALGKINSEEELRRVVRGEHVYEWLRAHFLPEIQLEPALWLRERQLVRAMIDVSDGVGQDVLRLLQESCLSCELWVDRLPPPAGVEGAELSWRYALDGGEDYALLVTISQEKLERLKQSYPREFPRFNVIGRLSPGPPALTLTSDGGRIGEYEAKGFDHFR